MSTELEFDPQTALLVVDVQNDFAHPRGNLYISGAEDIIPTINALIDQAKEAGASVVYTQDWHPERTSHFDVDGGNWPVHCVQETWGADLHANLKRNGGYVVRKGADGSDGYSAFAARDPQSGEDHDTGLARLLRDRGIERVVVVGLAQDVCVKETALSARNEGFETVLLSDATRPVDIPPGEGGRAIDTMRDAGVKVA
jgi:nicotinamidase/pyrazinamidase